MKQVERCGTCKFHAKVVSFGDKRCRRHAPRPSGDYLDELCPGYDASFWATWPSVDWRDDWCGEWEWDGRNATPQP